MKKKILLSMFSLFTFFASTYAQNPCGDGTIIINGDAIDAVSFNSNNKQGLSLPLWLTAGTSVAAGNRVKLISVIEFNEESQSVGSGFSLVYSKTLNIGATPETVPQGKVWKLEGIIKYSDPFIAGLSTGSNSPVCFGSDINLTSSVANATYTWTGPAGFTSSIQNPVINNADFTNAGKYYLTATHNGCNYSDTVNVVVNPLPASTFSSTYAIENYNSTFTPTVSGLNYSWTFDQGSPATSNAENPQVQWSTAGTYNVSLNVTDVNGCSSTTTNSITVSGCFINQPQSDFSWNSAIAGYSTAFTPDVSGATYNWTFDNASPSSSTDENPDVTWSNAGTYAVTLTVSTGNACYLTTQNVTVSACLSNQPESDFSWSVAGVGSNITFTPNNLSADSYQWTFNQGSTSSSSAQSPTTSWSSAGNYDVTLIASFNGVGCYTTTKSVQVINMITFTNCGQTGRTGPTQTQCNTAYSGTPLSGLVTVNGGIQEWVVPQGVSNITIEVYGAQGGNAGAASGGKGTKMTGDFIVNPNDVLKILVGQKGTDSPSFTSHGRAAGGGGGTYVATSSNTAMIIAGGGGGAGVLNNASVAQATGLDATTSNNGLAGKGSGALAGGTNGGGATTTGNTGASGGAGFIGNSVGYGTSEGGVAFSFLNGGLGAKQYQSSYGGDGGFGGGGAGAYGGGGGGGYSGGGVGDYNPNSCMGAGGGGSYNSGTNQINQAGVNTGDGKVIIYY